MIPATTANDVASSRPSSAPRTWTVAEDADDRALVGEDVQPGERPDEVRDEERRDDEEQEEVPPAARARNAIQ